MAYGRVLQGRCLQTFAKISQNFNLIVLLFLAKLLRIDLIHPHRP